MRGEPKNDTPLFAVCVDNAGYPVSLELHKIYRVLPDDDAAKEGDLRVIDESGEDYLYSADRFILVELTSTIERALLRGSSQRLIKRVLVKSKPSIERIKPSPRKISAHGAK